jgi:hypothetical protein
MKPKAVVFAAAVTSLMVACDASSPTATKQMALPTAINPAAIVYLTNTRDVPFTSTEPNPCNGDIINVNALSHFVIMTGFDNLGGLHYSANIVTKGSGVGTTKVYKINEHFHYVDQDPSPQDGYVIRQQGTIKVDGPQTADDYYTVVTFKTTVTANGDPTPVVESSYTKCGA